MNIRSVTTADAENVGQVIYKAFCGIADRHNFPRDFPTVEAAMQMAAMCAENPNVTGFVAENGGGEFLGSNFLWRHNSIGGVGPVTVDPNAQAKGVGKSLMRAVIEAGHDASGIRLVQDAFNPVSMSLYAGLGFAVVEPLVIMQGVPAGDQSKSPETHVRPIVETDLAACGELCEKIHGFDRLNELKETSKIFPSFVAERENRIVAYAAAPNFWQFNHAVAENAEDMKKLLACAANTTKQPLAFLLPTRQSELFRWCLAQKLKVVKPMNLMAMGKYQEPCGAFLPSVLY